MKKFSILLITLFIVNDAFTQSCLPQGIDFTTQGQIDSFQINYPNCTHIDGNVQIYGNDITNLNGLNVLTSIGSSLMIWDENILPSLAGLDNLTSIGGKLTIHHMDILSNLTGLDNLIYIGDNLEILYNTVLTSLTGLNALTAIGGRLAIASDTLTSFSGLNSLTSIGGEFLVDHNDHLTSFSGLDSLYSIGSNFVISRNFALPDFTGLNALTSIGGDLQIGNRQYPLSSGNPALISLTGLNGLTSICGNLDIIDNNALTSLDGLDNINAASITDLFILSNDNLSNCAVQSICDYLTSPNGTVWIEDNNNGCNDKYEVGYDCASISIEDLTTEPVFLTYPNPTSSSITISTTIHGYLSVLNLKGQELLQQEIKEPKTIIDVSALPSGIHLIKLINNKTIEFGKLIKE